MNAMTIGELIKGWRKEKGLTQKQLSEKTGIATITIQQYEGGKRVPKAEFLARIAQALEIPEHDFYDAIRTIYGDVNSENIMKPCKVIRLNDDAAVVIRFTDRIIKDYMDCKEKASVPGGPGKNCFECALDIPENEYCLRSLFPEIDKELEKRMVGELK